MYAKIFASMYDGSLATRGPWEALITFQQLLVLSDRFGAVDMTAEIISRRTTVPLPIIKKGIEELERPDPESRGDAHEGRRIIRLAEHRNWGWQIVNYERYHKIRSAEDRKEYMRNYMQQRRAAEDQDFSAFWAIYPRKVGKGTAEKAWAKIKPDQDLIVKIIAAVNEQRTQEQWTKDGGQFIPHPATWLNRKGWMDEAKAGIDFGRCHYCPSPAIGSKNGLSHCGKGQHMDFAKAGSR